MTYTNRMLLFGDSHTNAMLRAAERRVKRGEYVPLLIHRLRKKKKDKIIGDTSLEEFLDKICNLGNSDIVLSMIGGNQHAVFSTIQNPAKFDFFEPSRPDWIADHDAQIIPYSAIRDYFVDSINRGDGRSIRALRDSTSAHVVHVLPPPPKRDAAHILARHESRFAEDGIAQLGVSAPELRMKCWTLQTDVLTEFCGAIGVGVMAPPSEACDADGFLLREYYANDATHANPSYGELILQSLEKGVLTLGGDGA